MTFLGSLYCVWRDCHFFSSVSEKAALMSIPLRACETGHWPREYSAFLGQEDRSQGESSHLYMCVCRLHTVNVEPFETLYASPARTTHTPQWPQTNVCWVSKNLHCGNENPLPKPHPLIHTKKRKREKNMISPPSPRECLLSWPSAWKHPS